MAEHREVQTWPEPLRCRSESFGRDALLVTPFLLLFYLQLAHHVFWRDELNAFAITWVSPNIPSLFWHIHHEGHPWLWYVILWILSRFSESLVALKLLQAVIGTAILLLMAFRSPFRIWEKALLLAGYFFVFEYTVMTRMYGVILLLLILYLGHRVSRPDAPIISAVLLGFMASADTIGIILSGALLLEYSCAMYLRRAAPLFTRRTAIIATSIYALMLGLAVWSAKPAADISWRTTGRPFAFAKDPAYFYRAFLSYALLPFFPVKSPRSHFFWNPYIHRDELLYTLPMLVILGLLYAIFRRYPNLILLLASTILAGTLLGYLIYPGSERHFGVVFLAFFAGIWIIRAARPSVRLPIPVYILLAISAISSVWAIIASWHRPFSYDKAAAAWILENHLEQMPLVGEEDTSAVNVAQYLHRSVYMIDCSCVDSYLLYSTRRDDFKLADAPRRILKAEHFYNDVPLLFMLVHTMHEDERIGLEQEGFQIQPLAAFHDAEEISENFYFYRLELTHPSPDLH
jgi:hypothetical protein